MRSATRMLALTFVVGFAVVLLSGCEDQQTRAGLSQTNSDVSALRAKVEAVESENAKVRESIKALQEALGKQISDRMDRVEEKLMLVSKDLLDKVAKDAEQTRQTATTIVGSARGDYDKELTTVKTTLAGDIQKIREEMKGTMDDLKKYMDNQLRELYPYAYQPRRGDGKAPPEPDTK